MAVRFNSDASVLRRTANLPSRTAFTLAGWFNFVTVTPARFWGAMGLMNAVDGVSGRTIASSASGSAQLSLEYTNSGGSFVTVPLLTVSPSTWYFLALTSKGDAIGDVAAYIRGLGDKDWLNAVTNTAAGNTFTPGAVEFGREGFTGEFGDGDVFGIAAYDVALTSREVMLLSADLLAEKPFARARPNFYWRLRGNNDLWDRGGNARHPTITTPGVNRPGLRTWPRRRTGFGAAAAAGAISGTASWTWGQSGTLTGAGALSASVPWTWGQSATLRGAGAIAGTTAWQWGQSGTLVGAGALTGTIAWTWNQSGTLAGAGAMSGTSSWQWGQSGSLTGAGALAGTIPWTWSQTGDLTNSAAGAMTGTVSWTWGQSATLAGSGALAASVAWTWSQSANLVGAGALAGSVPWTWSQSGTLINATSGDITGSTSWAWDATGTLTSLTPPDQVGGGGSKIIGLIDHIEYNRQRRRRELDDIEELERETARIPNALDRQIAEQFREDERRTARLAEAERLQRLADAFASRPMDLPRHVADSIKRAAERRTLVALERMQLEILRLAEEQDAALQAALLLDED